MEKIIFMKSKEKAKFLQRSFLEEKPPLEERVIFYTSEDYKNFCKLCFKNNLPEPSEKKYKEYRKEVKHFFSEELKFKKPKELKEIVEKEIFSMWEGFIS